MAAVDAPTRDVPEGLIGFGSAASMGRSTSSTPPGAADPLQPQRLVMHVLPLPGRPSAGRWLRGTSDQGTAAKHVR